MTGGSQWVGDSESDDEGPVLVGLLLPLLLFSIASIAGTELASLCIASILVLLVCHLLLLSITDQHVLSQGTGSTPFT